MKVSRAHALPLQSFRLGRAGYGRLPGFHHRHRFKRAAPLQQFAIGVECHVETRALAAKVRNHHDSAGVRIRQRFEQDGVHRAEDRRRGSDAQGQRKCRDRCEARRAQHAARAVAQVLNQRFNEAHTARLAAFLFDALDPAKLQPRPPHCFMAHHAAAHQILCIRLHVESQLRIHLALHPRAPQRCLSPRTQPSPQRHSSSSIARRILRCPLLIRISAPPLDLRQPLGVPVPRMPQSQQSSAARQHMCS